jgi:hypothetical protein
VYLRRPPSKNEQYRLDRMLQAAAQRGVKVNVMVYKEVEKILTCKLIGIQRGQAQVPGLCIPLSWKYPPRALRGQWELISV